MALAFLPGEAFPIPIKALKAVTVYQDYDLMDRQAASAGFYVPETPQDERHYTSGHVGAQQSSLHSGWIATMGDESHSPEDQVRDLNEKVAILKSRGAKVIVGFCQTGYFSVGFSIYEKAHKKKQIATR